ncbi:RagB/SusD family nutrient uptake outer membrane protein [Pseudoflavitalea sp. G-6-1-2]|nr:RagB/SusD family nutrient uptake outer membrane protein [Pseudoflavitalea sp. G-6-1-2]
MVRKLLVVLMLPVCLLSCKKYLEEKPDKSLVLITSLDDIQKLLDRFDVMTSGGTSGLIELVADDYYLTDQIIGRLPQNERSNYLWDPTAQYANGWIGSYSSPVYYSNVILNQMPKITINANEHERYDHLKGAALFFRAWAFFHVAQLYCQPYDASVLQSPGIVLRLTDAILDKSERATIAQTYDQIMKDFAEAAKLLPENSDYQTRPTKAAAFGAMARASLAMRKYEDAGRFADSCLKRNANLIDYNSLDTTAAVPIERFNKETVFYSILSLQVAIIKDYARIDTNLAGSYAADDLRRGVYLNKRTDNSWEYNGSYEGSSFRLLFNGIATDEMYLIKAEAAARAGNTQKSMDVLNALLSYRWVTGTWQNRTAGSPSEAVDMILEERRKELLFRGLRWTDLRRLNLEGRNFELKRNYNGQEYLLKAGDQRWVMLVPDVVIKLSGIPQNPR